MKKYFEGLEVLSMNGMISVDGFLTEEQKEELKWAYDSEVVCTIAESPIQERIRLNVTNGKAFYERISSFCEVMEDPIDDEERLEFWFSTADNAHKYSVMWSENEYNPNVMLEGYLN